jgi:hypothetical protein
MQCVSVMKNTKWAHVKQREEGEHKMEWKIGQLRNSKEGRFVTRDRDKLIITH